MPTASIGREASAVIGAASRSTRLRKPMTIAPPKDTFLTSQKCFKMQLGWNQMYWPIFTNQQKL